MLNRKPADAAIAAVILAAGRYAEARTTELELEHGRPVVKITAIQRLMMGDNPLNGKPHSASSAEQQVETDAEYSEYQAKQRAATVNCIMRRAEYEAAKLTAALENTLAEVGEAV